MWLKDMFGRDDTRMAMEEILPDVYEVLEYSCVRCDRMCYVLPGLSLDLTKDEHKLIYIRYMAQKPLSCPVCKIYYCQKCAREGLMTIDVSEDARKRIAEQLEHRVKDSKQGLVLSPAFRLECGRKIDYA
jgi:hypothetical protein